MVDDALRCADELLLEPWKSKMKGIFSGMITETSTLQWDGCLLCVGEISMMGMNQFTLKPWTFTAGEGFRPNPKHDEINVVMMSHLPFRSNLHCGATVVCTGNGEVKTGSLIHFYRDAYVISRPEFNSALAWDFTHLFCGAFGGWSLAANWLVRNEKSFVVNKEIFIDHDEEVLNTWSRNHDSGYHKLPLRKVHVWNAQHKIACLGPISDLSILYAVESLVNHAATVSPPCVTWSRGGRSDGVQHANGWAFVDAVSLCVRMQVVAICLECADEFKTHRHACLIEKILFLAGYRRAWEQVCQIHQLADCFRNRWLALWVRADVPFETSYATFTLRAFPKTSRASEVYDFDLPVGMTEQLTLCPSELTVYADPALLPPAKRPRAGHSMEFEQRLRARAPDVHSPLPTLCAMYTSQHVLHDAHLKSKGIFAAVIQKGKKFYFLDPARWISLLGACDPISLPNKISLTFHQLGNAIAVPHALLVLLMLVQSTTKTPVAVNDLVQQLWHQRHKADSSVVLAGVEYWTLTKLDAYVRTLPTPSSPCTDQLFEALGATKVIVRNEQKTGSHLLLIPENWSVTQFLGQILQIDHNLFQHVTIANERNVFARHSTIQEIVQTRMDCIIKMKDMPVAHLSFPFDDPEDEDLPATLPFDVIEEVEECFPGIVSLTIPTFDQILESAIFARFLSILEAYYAATTVLTPSDAKQTSNMLASLNRLRRLLISCIRVARGFELLSLQCLLRSPTSIQLTCCRLKPRLRGTAMFLCRFRLRPQRSTLCCSQRPLMPTQTYGSMASYGRLCTTMPPKWMTARRYTSRMRTSSWLLPVIGIRDASMWGVILLHFRSPNTLRLLILLPDVSTHATRQDGLPLMNYTSWWKSLLPKPPMPLHM